MKYYNVFLEEADDLGTGRSGNDVEIDLPDSGPVTDWHVPKLDLVGGGFPDYLASDLGCRICSSRMRKILDSEKSETDVVQWLPVSVKANGGVRRYWLLHFPEPVEALGTRTIWQDKFVVKAVLSESRLRGHAVFTYPGDEGLALVVNERVKDALALAECTGLECAPAQVQR